MNIHPRFHLGTSGWSYPWQGIFYPLELRSGEYLTYYATKFDCTEINSCFYHYTMPKTVEKWLAETPDSFRFAPKMNREITHERKFVEVEAPLEKFMSRFLPMGKRLGPILIQIAASFRYQRDLAESFFGLLRQKYPQQAFAFEARHTSWFEAEALDLLREHEIGFVIASAGKRFPSLETVTSDTVYLRLHGEEKLYDSNYSEAQLEQYAFMIKDWLEDGKEIWMFFNNTMRGQAIADSEKLRGMLGNILLDYSNDTVHTFTHKYSLL
ncbi:MAG: DUF72 domain-containing protein [Phycisphaerae bacterium]|nr:DUF72 domain-containing protein [Saprospiraceae bacterium]